MISFEQWCLENNRLKTLSLWDYEKNWFSPSRVSSKAGKTVYLKCPNCGLEWTAKLRELSDPLLDEVSCVLCERKTSNNASTDATETKLARTEKDERSQIRTLISEKIGVVETVVTTQDEIAAVGVAIVESDGFQIIDAALWKIYLYGDYPDFGESLCYPELTNKKSFFYSNYKSVIDNASIREGTKAECISELRHYLSQHGVTSLFAYNGKQIKQQLIVLDNVEWFDLIIPFTAFRLNRFIVPNKIGEVYVKRYSKAGDYLIKEDGSV